MHLRLRCSAPLEKKLNEALGAGIATQVELSHPLLSSEGRYIQWEEVATRNNMEFPHLYGGPLPWECISRIHSVPRDDEGCPQLPEELLALCKGRD